MTGPPRRTHPPPARTVTPNAKIDFGLATAARRVVESALSVVPQEKVVLVYDRLNEELAISLRQAVIDANAEPLDFLMEELDVRPMLSLAATVRAAMHRAQASILVCGFQSGEYAMREEMIALAKSLRLRHAHMVGITRRSMIAGLAADPHRIARVSRALLVRMGPTSTIRARSSAGTDITVTLTPAHRWLSNSGLITAGKKENLPSGEIVTCPESVSGVYVADGTLGDATGVLNSSLANRALHIEIDRGCVQRIDSPDASLARRVSTLAKGALNLDRVALVSLGTNVGLVEPVGEIFVDQTLPSFHITLGLTFPERTGAAWTSASWIAFTQTESDVDIDGTAVMRRGRYLIE